LLSSHFWYEGMLLWCEELPEGETEGESGVASEAPCRCQKVRLPAAATPTAAAAASTSAV
jgi:hypothetical protein